MACGWDSLWVYSRTDGTGDRICFRGNGVLWMKDYDRYALVAGMWMYIGNWRLAWGSYWPGANSGGLNGKTAAGVWQRQAFARYGRQGVFHFDDGLDYIDLFAFHGINNDTILEHTKRCLDTAYHWKKEGRVRWAPKRSLGRAPAVQQVSAKVIRS